MASKPGQPSSPGMSLAGARVLARWCPARRRRESGLRLLHGTWEGGCRHGGRASIGRGAARGSAPSGQNREVLSTVAALAGGPACSSGEAPVMGAERRGRVISEGFARATGAGSVLGGHG
jgi:hypothetical protein